ncbi:hypothetical protein GQ55_6G166100 [Panicum hallii var. hallii]|uniref:Uncharacterized protein n=1 Tax=Panicum hallii var. hallii TaxID=1504633 RepID=A0A2T7D6M6_9POAL|nr:hypothetical protein GQ55_6G166100 [Panicum hallii var. hallii]
MGGARGGISRSLVLEGGGLSSARCVALWVGRKALDGEGCASGEEGARVLFSSGGCQRWCACVVAMLHGEGVRCGLVVVVRGVH